MQGKKSIVLDMEQQEGLAQFKGLSQSADIILTSSNPNFLEKRGLGYEELSKDNPGLIMTLISPFGQTGPYSKFLGSDLVCMAMSGVMNLTGDSNNRPLRIGVPQSGCHASLEAVVGTLFAFWNRVQYPGAPYKSSIPHYETKTNLSSVGQDSDDVLARLNNPSRKTISSGTDEVRRESGLEESTIFQDLKILDLSWVVTGPSGVRYLADYGVQVVRVESKTNLDVNRMARPFKDDVMHQDGSGFFASQNSNKYGITLNLMTGGTPEEIATAIAYLASDDARFITGAEFKIDDGTTIGSLGRD